MYTLYIGTFIHLPRLPADADLDADHKLSINHGALWVSEDGIIEGFDWSVKSPKDVKAFLRKKGWVAEGEKGKGKGQATQVKVVVAREDRNEFFFPGFVDTHIHAPQYPNTGLFSTSGLLTWLQTYTFPMESSFASPSSLPTVPPPQAYRVYNQVISRTLSHGTTTASYFATIHLPATNLLATLCHARGQRALIGRVCMDNPATCPDYLLDEPDSVVPITEASIAHIRRLDPEGQLINPVITPRFAPSCTHASLASLSELAASATPPLHIQTHLAENLDELALVHDLFPRARDYTSVYDHFGLLTPKTILAHAVHLSDAEREMIRDRKAKISHCPASNSALGSGICPVRRTLRAGIPVGLGTDVSGGYAVSMLEAVRQACLVSRLLPHASPTTTTEEKQKNQDIIDVNQALYLSTRGSAAVLNMAGQIGGFDAGMSWDAQLIRLGAYRSVVSGKGVAESNVDVFGMESWEEKVQKWVWSGDDRNVRAVWVGGRLVHETRDGR
ncbi:chlorohydrolase [Aspergillus heteromorphus CBS 117.55]|uniref:Guanine deaminase n=1 Tax=Aspergillus heteromorphus CBS 117.55 TaxID=1448321 RepID=A0A317VQG5_9EURO|nr:chlorohydrolase [Aspergillus heteromorphus CBS 117.55]PWY75531.1 chlorohydrolase [Aspergillus heteromorphus CBS 117.55]